MARNEAEQQDHPGPRQGPVKLRPIGSSNYVRLKRLGAGAYGEVVLAQHSLTGEEVAIKIASRALETKALRYLVHEVLNQRLLRHPHIIEFKEVFTAGPNQIGIAMEYASGGSLFTFVQRRGRLPESDARWFFQQLCMTLDFCHQRQVAHRDIKLENLLLKHVPGVPLPLLKICDFGFSKVVDQAQPNVSKVGTLAYMAPEVFTSPNGYDGSLADVWSCGVVLYVMLAGQYPFGAAVQERDKRTVMQRVIQAKWSIPDEVTISEDCRDLMAAILTPDPSKRLTMTQVMAHKWFLANLPPGALEYNRGLLQQPINEALLQPVEEITRVLGYAPQH